MIKSYNEETTGAGDFHMETENISLSQYAGYPVYIRFWYRLNGSHFSGDAGAWLDNVKFQNVLTGEWEDKTHRNFTRHIKCQYSNQ